MIRPEADGAIRFSLRSRPLRTYEAVYDRQGSENLKWVRPDPSAPDGRKRPAAFLSVAVCVQFPT